MVEDEDEVEVEGEADDADGDVEAEVEEDGEDKEGGEKGTATIRIGRPLIRSTFRNRNGG